MTTGKTIALTRCTFVGKVISLLFNMLSMFVRAFLPRSKYLLISWLQSLSAVIVETKKIKSVTAFTFSPSICHEVLKSRDITLPTKVCLVKAMVFPVVLYGCESWTVKKAECRRIWCFWTVVLEKTLESPLDCTEIQPIHSEGDQPSDFWKEWC